MAALGNASLLDLEPSYLLASTFGLGFSISAGSASFLTPYDTPALPVTGAYALAGTLDLRYRPPTEGQLWPRGDLDAERNI